MARGIHGGDILSRLLVVAGKLPEVFGEVDEGRTFFFNDRGSHFLVVWSGDLKGSIDIRNFCRGGDLVMGAKAAQERLQDPEGHSPKGGSWLIAVNPLFEIDLCKSAHSPSGVDVEEMRSLHAVTNREGDSLQHFTADGILTGKRLEKLGQLGVEEGEEGADKDLGNPAAPGGADFSGRLHEWTFVEGLYVLNVCIVNEGRNQPVDEAWVNVGDVGIHIADDIAAELVNRFPEVLPFAALEAVGREDVAGVIKICAVGSGDFSGPIGGSGINDG